MTLALLWRSSLFYLGMFLSLLVVLVLTIILLPLPFRYRYRVLIQWPHLMLWWLEKTCHLTYQVQGRENIPPGAAIVLSKHQSAWETIAITKIFSTQCWVLKRELLWVPLFGWAIATLKPIAINRKHLRQSMQQITEVGRLRLAEGISIIIFPEGTRVAPGEKGRYSISGALLATQTGYPIVPVAHNAGKFWPPRSFLKKPGTIQVRIGPVIETTGKSAKEVNALVEEWIEKTMLKLP